MATKIFSCSFTGLKCQIVQVEADISQGLPMFTIVGLGDASVQESKERVRSSIKNSGANFPQTRKTINLAPAEVRKQGSLFDLPIAVSILLATQQIPENALHQAVIVGELSLDGTVKKINGALPLTQHAKSQGFKKIFLPKDNATEAGFLDGIEIYPIESLRQFVNFCHEPATIPIQPTTSLKTLYQSSEKPDLTSLANIIGLEREKRALSIAAAGGHNLLLKGPPGTGKTILARAFANLLPQMSSIEILETTKIFSIAGLLDNTNPLVTKRPFREIHHTASNIAIIGGGSNPKPGEISLAHNGILFFDEITEFPRQVLESLRQPLEDKFININRVHYSLKFPCNFTFIATMNPCPCGYFKDDKVKCICSEKDVQNYQKKLSGPIKDRFDIFLNVPNISIKDSLNKRKNEDLTGLVDNINRAANIQSLRFKKEPTINRNGDMGMKEIQQYCHLDEAGQKMLNEAHDNIHLSNRGIVRLLKVARTIADLEASPNIQSQHLAEAIQYKSS